MATRYQFGRALEYQVMEELLSYGYWVMRSSASKGLVDVLALRGGEILLIQAKRNGRLDPKEWNNLYRLALGNKAKALLARKKDSGIGNSYRVLTGEKTPHHRHPPYEIWAPTAPGQGALWE